MYQGSTFNEILRWESSKKIYKSITGITQAAPCVVTAVGHGVPNGWRVKITNVGGMTDINDSSDYVIATVLTTDTIELNSINSLGYKTYTSGGVVEYNEPVDLSGYTARMQLRAKVDSTDTIDEYTTGNGLIILNTTDSFIQFDVSAAITKLYTFSTAVYSLELESGIGVVSSIATGTITLVKEVTR